MWGDDSIGRRTCLRNMIASAGAVAGATALWPTTAHAAPKKLPLVAAFEGHEKEIHYLCFSRDGKSLVSASTDQTIRFWTLPESKPPFPKKFRSDRKDSSIIRCPQKELSPFISVLPDGQTLFVADWRGNYLREVGALHIRHWNIGDRKEEGTPPVVSIPSSGPMRGLSPDGRLMVISFTDNRKRSYVRLVDRTTGKEVVALPDNFKGGTSAWSFSPDTKRMVLGGAAIQSVQMWDLGSKKIDWAVRNPNELFVDGIVIPRYPRCLVMSAEGTRVLVVSDSHKIQIYDANNGNFLSSILARVPLSRVAMSRDNKFIAAAGIGWIFVWETKTNALVAFEKRGTRCNCLLFSPCGKYLAFDDLDNSVRLLAVESGGN